MLEGKFINDYNNPYLDLKYNSNSKSFLPLFPHLFKILNQGVIEFEFDSEFEFCFMKLNQT